MKVTRKIVNVSSDLKSLFRHYLTITKHLNKLRPKEIDVLATILYYNEIEKPNFANEEDRWKKVMGYDGKLAVREALNMEEYNLNNLLTSLRKKGAIIDNKVSPYYIPKIEKDTTDFQIIFNFHINGQVPSNN